MEGNNRIALELEKRIELGNFNEIAEVLKLYESAKKVPAMLIKDIKIGDKTYGISFPGSAMHDFKFTCSDGRVLLIDVFRIKQILNKHINVGVCFILAGETFEVDFSGVVASVPLDSESYECLNNMSGRRLVSSVTPSYIDLNNCFDNTIEFDWNLVPYSLDETVTDKELSQIKDRTRRLFKKTIFTKEELTILTNLLKEEIEKQSKKSTNGKIRVRVPEIKYYNF